MEQYNELKSLIEKQAAEINDLRNVNQQLVNVVQTTMVYDYVDDNMPDWARPAVQAAMDCGAVQGDENGRLGLSYKDLRAICSTDVVCIISSFRVVPMPPLLKINTLKK